LNDYCYRKWQGENKTMRQMLKSKIHRATVTRTNLDYTGSLTVDSVLLKALNILPYEKVQVANINNGARFDTYIIEGEADTGTIEVNGAAARLAAVDDKVIIISYQYVEEKDAAHITPRMALVDDKNKIVELSDA